MKYVNCNEVLPEELVEEIRKYVEGVYVYVPVKDDIKYRRSRTEHQVGLAIRNDRIFDAYLRGDTYDEVAKRYCLSDKSIRRIVLTKKREMEIKRHMINEMLNWWDLTGEATQINHTSWDIDHCYVIKEYKEDTSLKRNIEMMRILGEAGLPVPKVIRTTDGYDFIEVDENYYMVTSKLKGEVIKDPTLLGDEWFNKFGQIIGQLHQGFKQCEQTMSFWNNSMIEEMEGWVRGNLEVYKPDYLKLNDMDDSIERLARVYKDLPKQLIHRDVHVGNFLFDGNDFSGYIDFDLSQSNIRIFDLCYFLPGLLSKESGAKDYDVRWFEIVGRVVAGYDSIIQMTDIEKASVLCVMECIELLFVAYFLSQKDDILARNAASIYYFIRGNSDKVSRLIK